MTVKNLPVRSVLLLLIIIVIGCAPANQNPDTTVPVAENIRIDYNGTYTGLLPCADCEGIETIVTLKKDLSYIVWRQYKGKSDLSYAYTGKYTLDTTRHLVTLLDMEDAPSKYLARPEILIQLDMNGEEITGKLADRYILRKTVESKFAEIRWNLIELFGKPLERSAAHIRFDVDGKMVNGYGWCNTFHGGYEMKGGNEIRFDEMVPTRRTCPDTTAEQQFLNMFAAATSFALNGKTLSLGRGGAVPLAKFEALESKR